MPPVAIVSDTCHYLPADLVAEHGLTLVPLYVNRGDRQDRESDITDYDAFYRELAEATDLPTTSQPSIGDFLAVYEPLVAEGRDVVSVHLSGGISGTVESARQAAAQIAEQHGDRVTVVDSETGCGGQGMLLLAGARAAARGEDAASVADQVRATRAELKIWFGVETLEFLRRGGRIGMAQAWVGAALQIKPILTLEREITPVERVRTSKRLFERMVEHMRERLDDGADGWVVQHIQAPELAERLVERGREVFGSEPLFVSEVGPVIGAHVGPGLVGVGGVPRSRFA